MQFINQKKKKTKKPLPNLFDEVEARKGQDAENPNWMDSF